MNFREYYLKSPEGELYARDAGGGEYYAKSEDGDDYYARGEDGGEYYAKSATGDEYCAREAHGEPYYARRGREMYPKNAEGHEYYESYGSGGQFYAVTEEYHQYYAKDRYGFEHYAKLPFLDGEKEVYAFQGDRSIYATRTDGSQYYARDHRNNEMHNYENYAVNQFGDEIYPKDSTGRDEVFRRHGRLQYARDREGNELYPRIHGLDEYYPSHEVYPLKKDGSAFYARSGNPRVLLFPRKARGEEYIYHHETGLVCLDGLSRYALDENGSEIYPVSSRRYGREIVLNDRYALTEGNIPAYPLDSCGNEYLLKDASGAYRAVLGYPLASDGSVIVPEGPGGPAIDPKLQPKITIADITGRMPQDEDVEFSGFSTNVKGLRQPRVFGGCRFTLSDGDLLSETRKEGGSYWMTLLCILMMVAMIAVVAMMVLK